MAVVTATYRFTGQGEDFGPRGNGLVILHTTESPAGQSSVAHALELARWQDRDDVAGSYNRLICTDGVVSCVPDDHASGGTNPFDTLHFKPKAWLYDALPANVVNNPNAYALQLSAMGPKAYFDENGWPPGIIDGFARSILEEAQRIGRMPVIANHADFQTDRSDAGPIATQLVMDRLAELQKEDSVDHYWRPVQEDWTTVVGAPFEVGGETKYWTQAVPITTFMESGEPDGSGGLNTPKTSKRMARWPQPDGLELMIIPRTSISPVPGSRREGWPTQAADCTDEIAEQVKRVDALKGDAALIVPILERMRTR